MKAAIAILLIAALPAKAAAADVDGGTPDAGWASDPLYAECPKGPPPSQLADGSWVLPPARAARNVCLLETCEARRQQLEAGPVIPTFSKASLLINLVVWGLGVVLGIYFGWTLKGSFR